MYNNIQIFPSPFSLLTSSFSASRDMYMINAVVTTLVSMNSNDIMAFGVFNVN
jgi:hypothetical protein